MEGIEEYSVNERCMAPSVTASTGSTLSSLMGLNYHAVQCCAIQIWKGAPLKNQDEETGVACSTGSFVSSVFLFY